MPKSKAKIHVEQLKIVALIDKGVADYYYSLIPAHMVARRPLYSSKITIVRNPPIERFSYDEALRYNGREIEFEYDSCIQYKSPYLFLEVWSPEIEEIRKCLGLPKFREGYKNYHITIGNVKP